MRAKCEICQSEYEIDDGGRVDIALHTHSGGLSFGVLTLKTCPLCAGKVIAYIYQMKRKAMEGGN